MSSNVSKGILNLSIIMKIIYIVVKGMPLGGGIEKYTEELSTRLAERGHEVNVYSMRHYGATNSLYKGIKIKTIPTIKMKSLEKIVASLVSTIYLLFEKNIDIVHYHAFGPGMFSFIPRLFGKKVIVQGHGLEWMRSKWGIIGKLFLKFSEYPSILFPNKITAVSKVQKEYIKNKYHRDCIYIPTGVNKTVLQKPEIITEKYNLKGNDYILFAARLVEEKGAHYLIKAYNNLKTDKKLVIAGDAYYQEKYKSELKKLANNSENIIFPGFVVGKELSELFSNCYFFVLPSELEGLPIALLEAMSYGNCCLVSDIPENLEAIESYGFTFNNKDIEDLTKQMNFLLKNKDKVDNVKKIAKSHVMKNYSWDDIADKFEEVYLEMIRNKRFDEK